MRQLLASRNNNKLSLRDTLQGMKVKNSPYYSSPFILYSAKFSRRIIFAFFADWSGAAEIRCRERRK